MDGVDSTPMPFFLFLDTCFSEAVKKQHTSGRLEVEVYQWLPTAAGVRPICSATAVKQKCRFWQCTFAYLISVCSCSSVHLDPWLLSWIPSWISLLRVARLLLDCTVVVELWLLVLAITICLNGFILCPLLGVNCLQKSFPTSHRQGNHYSNN